MNGLNLDVLENAIGYKFRDRALLTLALTHSSFSNENKDPLRKGLSNERLEFLGDAVLQIIISDYLYTKYSDKPEGVLTQLRQHIVCEGTLSRAARKIALGQHLFLGRGEQLKNGQNRDSILADAFEAMLAAIYIDSGRKSDGAAKDVLLVLLKEEIEDCLQSRGGDYKTQLQQLVQQGSTETLKYVLISEEGPAHSPVFIVRAMLNSNVIGEGKGKTKREAEQQAAKAALNLFGELE